MKKILITGGSGFVGSYLSEHLLKNKFFVFSIDKRKNPYIKNKKSFRNILEKVENVKSYKKVLSQVDGVVHLSGISRTGESFLKLSECFVNNLISTTKLIESISTLKNPPWLLYAGSIISEREKNKKMKSPYGLSKYASIEILKTFSSINKIKSGVIYFPDVYGVSRDHKTKFIHIFKKRILENKNIQLDNGNAQFDLINVGTLVKNIYKIILTISKIKKDKGFFEFIIKPEFSIRQLKLAKMMIKKYQSNSKIIFSKSKNINLKIKRSKISNRKFNIIKLI